MYLFHACCIFGIILNTNYWKIQYWYKTTSMYYCRVLPSMRPWSSSRGHNTSASVSYSYSVLCINFSFAGFRVN